MSTERVHITLIRVGDTIIRDGVEKTVSGTDLKKCRFMGVSIFGDTYNLGYKPVIRVKP